jgi:hypothetical protein
MAAYLFKTEQEARDWWAEHEANERSSWGFKDVVIREVRGHTMFTKTPEGICWEVDVKQWSLD